MGGNFRTRGDPVSSVRILGGIRGLGACKRAGVEYTGDVLQNCNSINALRVKFARIKRRSSV